MGSDPVHPPLMELDSFLDPSHPTYGFDTDEWVVSPTYVAPSDADSDRICQRLGNADAFQQSGSPIAWYRYVTLGFYVYDDCPTFDRYWRQFARKQLICSKMVWYNYKYHVDRKLHISPHLNAWATDIARPYICKYEPLFLTIDTNFFTWESIISSTAAHDEDMEDDPAQWSTVGPSKSKSRKATSSIKSAFKATTPTTHTGPPPHDAMKSPHSMLSKLSSLGVASSKKRSTTFADLVPPTTSDTPVLSDQPPPVTAWSKLPPFTPASPPATIDNGDIDMSDAKNSTYQSTLNNTPTNDGTFRLTIRWKHKSDFRALAANKAEWLTKFLTILQSIFSDNDGLFYRWESKDLTSCTPVSKLTQADFRDYISPSISSLFSTSTFVFGLRFGFASKNHIAWRMQSHLNNLLKSHGVVISVSNSTTSSGDLVTAGFLLFKAPNTTHRIKYLQHLRNKLPNNTPFFDIVLHKRTPTGENYHHLVVECGKNHLTPLTAALGLHLTGKASALFLPRLALSKLTNEQIQKYFAMHQSYIRSLRPIKISPGITQLDKEFMETMDDGSTLERTTREWATSLFLADGVTSARCDVVNGSPDQQLYLLVPQPYFDEIKEALRVYRVRLNLLGQRESRFRDSLPDLPSVIHVDVSTQANLDFLEFLSSDEKWRRAPDSVRGGKSNQSETSAPDSASRFPPGTSSASSLENDSSAVDQPLWPPPDGPGKGKTRSQKSSKKSPDVAHQLRQKTHNPMTTH